MNFHICSLLGDPGWWNPFGFPAAAFLTDYFAAIAAQAKTGPIIADLMPRAEDVKDADLLVYVLRNGNSFNSIIANLTPSTWAPDPTRGGLTTDVAGQGSVSIVSEVYWDRVQGDSAAPKLLANLIFHEFMHNKLDVVEHHAPGEEFVHNSGGGGLAVGTRIRSNMSPSKTNTDLMAAAIRRKHPQHTGHLRVSDIPPGRPIRP